MTGFARPCLVCGRRVEGGSSRCADHAGQRYAAPMGCYVCGRQGPKGYCPDHDPWAGDKPESERLERQPWRAGYRTAQYRANRKRVIERAGGRCEKCHQVAYPLEVDHIVPLSQAKHESEFRIFNDLSNLIGLCIRCHRAKTARREK